MNKTRLQTGAASDPGNFLNYYRLLSKSWRIRTGAFSNRRHRPQAPTAQYKRKRDAFAITLPAATAGGSRAVGYFLRTTEVAPVFARESAIIQLYCMRATDVAPLFASGESHYLRTQKTHYLRTIALAPLFPNEKSPLFANEKAPLIADEKAHYLRTRCITGISSCLVPIKPALSVFAHVLFCALCVLLRKRPTREKLKPLPAGHFGNTVMIHRFLLIGVYTNGA